LPGVVEEDKGESCPKCTEHGKQAHDETDHDARWNQVAESFASEKARKGVDFHRLKDVLLCSVKHFRIVTAFILNCMYYGIVDSGWEDDFALGSWKEVRVENLHG